MLLELAAVDEMLPSGAVVAYTSGAGKLGKLVVVGMLPFVVLGRFVAVNDFFVFCLRKPFARVVKKQMTELCFFIGMAWKLL